MKFTKLWDNKEQAEAEPGKNPECFSLVSLNATEKNEDKPEVKTTNRTLADLQSEKQKLSEMIINYKCTDLQPELDEIERQIELLKPASKNFRYFNSPYGKIEWDLDKKIISVAETVWTEDEILKIHSTGTGITDFEFELKRNIKKIKLINIEEYNEN